MIKNKPLCITFAVFFILLVVIVLVPEYTRPLDKERNYSAQQRAAIMAEYEIERDKNQIFYAYLNGEDVSLPDNVLVDGNGADMYKREYLYYDYLITTNTLASEYCNYSRFTEAHRGSYMMTSATQIFAHVLPVLSLLAVFLVLGSEYNGGTVKNLTAAPLTRRSVFIGKALFLCAVNAFLFMLAHLVPCIAGLTDLSATQLIYGANGYYVQSTFVNRYLPAAFATLMSMLFCSALSMLCGQFVKKRAWGLLLPIAVYLGVQLLFGILEWSVGTSIYMMPLSYMRYVTWEHDRIFANFSTGWAWLIAAAAAVMAFAALSTYIGARKIQRQDF